MPRNNFRDWDKDRHKQVSIMGGITAQLNGTAHRFTHEEAVKFGSIGGRIAARNRRLYKLNEKSISEIESEEG